MTDAAIVGDADLLGDADVDATLPVLCVPGVEPSGWMPATPIASFGVGGFSSAVTGLSVALNEAGVAVFAFRAGSSIYVTEQHDGCWGPAVLVTADSSETGVGSDVRVGILESGGVMVAFSRMVGDPGFVFEQTVWATHRASVTSPFSTPEVVSERMTSGGGAVGTALVSVVPSGDAFAIGMRGTTGIEQGAVAVVFEAASFGPRKHLSGGAANPNTGGDPRVVGDGAGGFTFVWVQQIGNVFGSVAASQYSIFAERYLASTYQAPIALSPFVVGDWSFDSLVDVRRTEVGAVDLLYRHASSTYRRTFDAAAGSWSTQSLVFAAPSAAGAPSWAQLLPNGEVVASGYPVSADPDDYALFRWDSSTSTWDPTAPINVGDILPISDYAFLPGANGDVEIVWKATGLAARTAHADLALTPRLELVPDVGFDFDSASNVAGKSVVAAVRATLSTAGTESRPTVATHRP